jgi:hypothetical protein
LIIFGFRHFQAQELVSSLNDPSTLHIKYYDLQQEKFRKKFRKTANPEWGGGARAQCTSGKQRLAC